MPDIPFVLLPPSVGKAEGGRGRYANDSGRFGALAEARSEVIAALAVAAAERTAAKLLGATGPLLDRAIEAVAQLADGTAPALPAWKRYTGVVWEHLDPATLSAAQRGRLIVPSAVLGASTGTDPVPDHRLSFAASLPGIGRLDRWWRETLTDAVAQRVRRGSVLDLLPNEHAAALDLDRLACRCRLVTVRFRSADGARAVGHAAKAAKGAVARAALVDGIDALGDFRWEGWRATRVGNALEVRAPA